jgi:hypothetical protein
MVDERGRAIGRRKWRIGVCVAIVAAFCRQMAASDRQQEARRDG